LCEITFFCPAVIAKNSLNASPGFALDVLCHFSLCADFGNKTLSPIMTLAKKSDTKYLIVLQTASSQPLGHPDGGREEAVFKLV
jgi:hypothetical protein